MVADNPISVWLVLNKMQFGGSFLVLYRPLRSLHIMIKLFLDTNIQPFMITGKSSTGSASLEILLRSGLSLDISLVAFKSWVFSFYVLLSLPID